MGKIISYILGAYVLYYLGNIVYDLFLAKGKVIKPDDDGDVISLGDLVNDEYQYVENIALDEFEELENTPSPELENAFSYTEDQSNDVVALQQSPEKVEEINLDEQNKRLQEEQDLNKATVVFKDSLLNESDSTLLEKKEFAFNATKSVSKWADLLEQAATNVMLTSNDDGHKVFKSTL